MPCLLLFWEPYLNLQGKGGISAKIKITTNAKFSLTKNIEILEDSLELMLGGRSSSEDDKMIAGMVSS
jgi:hypothetical protein